VLSKPCCPSQRVHPMKGATIPTSAHDSHKSRPLAVSAATASSMRSRQPLCSALAKWLQRRDVSLTLPGCAKLDPLVARRAVAGAETEKRGHGLLEGLERGGDYLGHK
jgi:hypothetical protein